MFKQFDPLKGKQLRVLDQDGRLVAEKWLPDLPDAQLVEGYKQMLRARIADQRALGYQRQKRVHTLPTNLGQEAAAVASAMALDSQDWLVQAYRELGAVLTHGGSIRNYLLYFKGSEWGAIHDNAPRLLPPSVPISSQIPHAVGIAHAIRYRGGKEVVIVYFGDGGTSQGDFHEGLNWAGVFQCPVVFFCNNNQYAISLNRSKQTKSETLAQKAIAYGMPGIQVDGNDFLAVYRATSEAVEHARSGKGPVLIEAYTYRMGAHTTSDDPSIYRSKEEEEEWSERCPLKRMRLWLSERGLWDEARETAWTAEVEAEVDAAMKEVDAINEMPLDEVFQYMYADKPVELEEQQKAYESYQAWKEAR